MHGQVSENGRQAQTGHKLLAPGGCILARNPGLPHAVRHRGTGLLAQKMRSQQCRRLQGHAHAFAQDRVRLTCSVTNLENSVTGGDARTGI